MNLVWTGQFKKDYKRAKKQGRDLAHLRDIVEKLASGIPLPPKNYDHTLAGRWKKHRECHINPDWLLIYRIDGEDVILERVGSHSELFG
ncbi:MAG TPA: type II toxin-antitoxin system YafQ family toxin [Sedimentisphaerales bacterium]|nr:type II toxin-antitoxin system YafQ family toxin [Sedimentisphaerales bacterium]HRS09934.1 type II toxin-antitoxin system YafQ family toxin [Sedimentisphaerales bacterium]HRV46640.1 type II toxin-antitoxin system YafQ family toxin [Sedimentisphaerales bacterium]